MTAKKNYENWLTDCQNYDRRQSGPFWDAVYLFCIGQTTVTWLLAKLQPVSCHLKSPMCMF